MRMQETFVVLFILSTTQSFQPLAGNTATRSCPSVRKTLVPMAASVSRRTTALCVPALPVSRARGVNSL